MPIQTKNIMLKGDELQQMLAPLSCTVSEALRCMNNEAALVVDRENVLRGLVTDGDLRRAFLKGAGQDDPISEIMTPEPLTAFVGTPLKKIAETMVEKSIRHLPVVDRNKRPVGVVLLKYLLNENLNPKAVVMAGGKGVRLRPLTETTPKPLLKIGDETILDSVLNALKKNGVNDVVITLNYLGDQIREHAGEGTEKGMNINYVEEKKRLGTAGALALIRPRPEDCFLVMNADLLTEVDIRALSRFHRESGHHATICVKKQKLVNPFGVVRLDRTDRVVNIEEKPVYDCFVNAGIYMLEPHLIDLIPYNTYFDMTSLLQRTLETGGTVGAFPILEYWRDIGRHEEMKRVELERNLRNSPNEMYEQAAELINPSTVCLAAAPQI